MYVICVFNDAVYIKYHCEIHCILCTMKLQQTNLKLKDMHYKQRSIVFIHRSVH